MLKPEHVHVRRADGVGFLTIDRRNRFNSLDVSTARELRHAGLQLARDDDVRVVVVQGVPGVFCTGADLKYVDGGGHPDDLRYLTPAGADAADGHGAVFKQILEYLHATISEIERAPKPVVAAVDGVAAAGGFGLAMACDLVVASERSSFEWAYAKTGLSGAESATFFLPRLIGLRRSLELVLLNPRLDAPRALAMGLVTAVYPTERFDGEVLDLARRLAAGPTSAYGVAKRLIHRAAGVDGLDRHLDEELESLVRVADGKDFAAGLQAFLGKRPARFTGR
ncbi:MAG TPA: enoyl-CoA hydratase-related protein [Candidatus Binatia bacterium]|jgi:2-(1,2-epoxy-1,2-dihydrophenyl)acetyl-CoA isomerase|nr:enoyl-CoA hydratase-related protein [Candidatus Binatia bacterium]